RRVQGMGKGLPPPAALPLCSRPRLQGMGRSLPPPTAPPLCSHHRRRTQCNPASMGCCAACPLQ
ncbi:hypothetical protein NDU88_008178, partial [Pleurodeles waltl]